MELKIDVKKLTAAMLDSAVNIKMLADSTGINRTSVSRILNQKTKSVSF